MQNVTIRLFAIVVASGLMLGCDAYTSVRGHVLDSEGKPIENAAVRLSSPSSAQTRETLTRFDGQFQVGIIHGPFAHKFKFEVVRNGFEPFTLDVKPRTIQVVDVRLRRVTVEPSNQHGH